MDEFFNSLKVTGSIEKSLRATDDYLKEKQEMVYKRQAAEMLTDEEAKKIFENNLIFLKRYRKIKEMINKENL